MEDLRTQEGELRGYRPSELWNEGDFLTNLLPSEARKHFCATQPLCCAHALHSIVAVL